MGEPATGPSGGRIRHQTLVRGVARERCYDALATGEGLDAWFTSGAEVDPRPGGTMTWRWRSWGPWRDVDERDGGPVLEARRPERFVFRWNRHLAAPTTVELDFLDHPDGTVVRVTDSGYGADAEARRAFASCSVGWGEALTLLKVWLEHGVRYHQDPPAPSLEALSDLRTPWCIRVVATLRIAEHLAAGVGDVDRLAAAAGCDAAALHNVLGHLVGVGVFEQPAPGRFALNDAGRQLLDQSRFLDLEGIGGRMAHAWGTLLTYVRTGAPGYAEAFGLPFWEDLAAHPDVAASFDALMGPAGHGSPDTDPPLSGGWAPVRTVVDVGGGTGAMLAAVLRTHPHVHGVLVDHPGTVARSAAIFRDAGVADRVRTVGQSFFDPLPAGADLYLLKKVLNDWPERETVAILRRCAEAARPAGRVLVLGGVSAAGAPRRLEIEMVLLGGTTNTLAEFRELARRAGLEVTVAVPQPSGGLAVECRPL
jgi:uncharacterized protein YndB with AHSA1/START domain